MGLCKYCGEDAGFLKKKHKECSILHDVNKNRIGKMIYFGFFGDEDMTEIKEKVINLAKKSYITPKELDKLYISVYNKIVKQFLYDGIITHEEELRLTKFKKVFNFDQEFLDQHGLFQKFIKALVVRDVANKELPNVDFESDFDLPFKLEKGEKIIWLFDNVELYEKKKKKKSKHIRNTFDLEDELFFSSTFSNEFIKTKGMTYLNIGQFVITNKKNYFVYDNDKYIEVRIKNLANLFPYQDGFGLKPKDKTGSLQVFKNLDGWFAYNVIFNLNR
ncbi:MAG TPA: hypothetical protein PK674_01805 [Candidatus Absconditabacterales bacterium]|nr:hypothetical protein [Candidatus Absconditabacterales bacterium]